MIRTRTNEPCLELAELLDLLTCPRKNTEDVEADLENKLLASAGIKKQETSAEFLQ
jgi:hypothetical protein